MSSGSSCRLEVSVGDAPIRFFFAHGGPEYRTAESVVIEFDSRDVAFAFSNETQLIMEQ
jgi:hypothetical protein